MAKESLPETGNPELDKALRYLSLQQKQQTQVSTGAGLAIAAAWIAGSAVTVTILLILFVLTPTMEETKDLGVVGGAVLIFLIALPMIAAHSITRVILSKE